MTHAQALADWQRRFDAAHSVLERLALMVELEDRLRPDVWERRNTGPILTGITE